MEKEKHYSIAAYYINKLGETGCKNERKKWHSIHNTCVRKAINDYPMEPPKWKACIYTVFELMKRPLFHLNWNCLPNQFWSHCFKSKTKPSFNLFWKFDWSLPGVLVKIFSEAVRIRVERAAGSKFCALFTREEIFNIGVVHFRFNN